MYTIDLIRANGTEQTIHDPSQGIYAIGAKLREELNASPSLTFDVDATNPVFNELAGLVMSKAQVSVHEYDGEVTDFVGRVLSVQYDRLGSTATVTCEGFLSALNDYVLEPYAYTGSPAGYIAAIVANANAVNPNGSPTLEVGTVTVIDPNDNIVRASETHVNLWDEVRAKTFGSALGGYVSVTPRYNGAGVVSSVRLNWKITPTDLSSSQTQGVTFTRNMLSCDDTTDGGEAFSGIYPTGAEISAATSTGRDWVKLDEETSTGDFIRQGRCIYEPSLVDQYGYIVRHVSYPNITLKANLLEAAKETLIQEGERASDGLKCRAVDMVDAGESVLRFTIGQPTVITYPYNGSTLTRTRYLVKMTTDLCDPSRSEFEFGILQKDSTSASSTTEGGGYAGDTDYSHAEGYMTTASGFASHAKGSYALASGTASDATGGGDATEPSDYGDAEYYAVASGDGSHAEGCFVHASGDYAHAEGLGCDDYAYEYGIYANRAEGEASHAEGFISNATGKGAHAEGCGYLTDGVVGGKAQRAAAAGAHAEGRGTHALHAGSHAEGIQTETGQAAQHVGGKYNAVVNDAAVVIGNGSESGTEGSGVITRSNCLVLGWDGKLDVSGGYYVNGQPISGGGGSQTTWYGTCSTASTTAEKAVTCSGFTLAAGAIVAVLFTAASTAATPTLNVNGTGAKSIFVGSIAPTGTTNVLKWSANTVATFMYDGTQYRYLGGIAAANTTQPLGAATWYGTSSSAATATAKTSSISNFRLTAGAIVSVTFTYASTVEGALTLNVNSTGAKAIYKGRTATSTTNVLKWSAGETLTFMYSGTYWYYLGSSSGGYTLPPATSSTLGGVKVGSGLSVASDGTLSTTGGGGSGDYTGDIMHGAITASDGNGTFTVTMDDALPSGFPIDGYTLVLAVADGCDNVVDGPILVIDGTGYDVYAHESIQSAPVTVMPFVAWNTSDTVIATWSDVYGGFVICPTGALAGQTYYDVASKSTVVTKTFDLTVASTAAANNSTNTVDVTNGTFTPIGIVGGQWVSGTRQNYMNLWQSYISGTTATIRFCNLHASQTANGVYRITVLYKK